MSKVTAKPVSRSQESLLMVVNSKAFSMFFISVVLFQVVLLVIEHPTDTDKWYQSTSLNAVFCVLYTVEVTLKIVAFGGKYFKSAWNWLDLLLLATQYLDTVANTAALSSLRALRLLRPLRAVNKIPSLRVLIATIMGLKGFVHALLVVLSVAVFFAAIGLDVYQGALHNRCTNSSNGIPFLHVCASSEQVSAGTLSCWSGSTCKRMTTNPSILHFDNIGSSLLVISGTMAMEKWAALTRQYVDATGYSAVAINSISVLILGFLTSNLLVAVVTNAFGEKYQEEEAKALIRRDEEISKLNRMFLKKWRKPLRQSALLLRKAPSRSMGEKLMSRASTFITKKDPLEWYNRLLEETENEGVNAKEKLEKRRFKSKVDRLLLAAQKQYQRHDLLLKENPTCSKKMYKIYDSRVFQSVSMIVIIVNVGVLAIDWHGISSDTISVLESINLACLVFFSVELIVSLTALHIWVFFSSFENLFDLLIVVVAWIEYSLPSSSGALSVLRVVRIFRITRLFKNLKSLRVMFVALAQPLFHLANLLLIIAIFVFVYASMGTQLYFDKIPAKGFGRANFATLGYSSLSVLQMLTADNWLSIASNLLDSTTEQANVAYAIMVFLVGYVLCTCLVFGITLYVFQNTQNAVRKAEQVKEMTELIREKEQEGENQSDIQDSSLFDAAATIIRQHEASDQARIEEDCKYYESLDLNSQPPADTVFFCLTKENPFRVVCLKIVDSFIFNGMMAILIFASSVCLALEHPGMDATLKESLEVLDIIFAVCFVLEMLTKWCAYGLKAYWTRGFDFLDGVVTVLSLISLGVPSVAIFRSFRALRPFALITKSKFMKHLLLTVAATASKLIALVLVQFLLFFSFSIVGVKLFKGLFYACTDPAVLSKAACTGSFVATTATGNHTLSRYWKNTILNFDNPGYGVVSVFQLATMRGWSDMMYRAMHSGSGVDMQPQSFNNPLAALFFVAAVLICGMYMFSTFSALVIDSFIKIGRLMDKSALLSPQEREYLSLQPALKSISQSHKREEALLSFPLSRRKLCQFFLSIPYEISTSVLIQLSVVVSLLAHYNAPAWTTQMGTAFDYFFVIFFGLETLLKLYGFQKHVFKNSLMLCEFIATFAGAIVVILDVAKIDTKISPSIFRLPLAVFSFRHIPALRKTYYFALALVRSLRYAIFAALLSCCFISIFAIIGVGLFAKVRIADPMTFSPQEASYWHDPFGWGNQNVYPAPLDRNFNFKTFFHAFISTLQIVSMDNWAAMMEACSIRPPYCTEGVDCGNFAASAAFFVSCIVICRMIVMSLFMAIVFKQLSESSASKLPRKVGSALMSFRREWSKLASGPEEMFFLPAEKLAYLLQNTNRLLRWEIADVCPEVGKLNVSNAQRILLGVPKEKKKFSLAPYLNIYCKNTSKLEIAKMESVVPGRSETAALAGSPSQKACVHFEEVLGSFVRLMMDLPPSPPNPEYGQRISFEEWLGGSSSREGNSENPKEKLRENSLSEHSST
mmetsp:Transcript_2043/g.3723  ORF Transcript_2043/g.3723 Transcript_2043/m.3723 type:complete len:1496 (+) Transcript_2043:2108-6595(+)